MPRPSARVAFTLIELLVVIAIISLLVAIILPSMSSARQSGISAKCLSNLRVQGQGLVMYGQVNGDVLVPGRLPRVDDCNWYADLPGGQKYRPTFMAMIGAGIGLRAFEDPQACRGVNDVFGEPGDRQNYSNGMFVCPRVADWTDERNACYGYNYQFIGNSRLLDPNDLYSFKNWPVVVTRIRGTATTVAVADSLGSAATVASATRMEYSNNGGSTPVMGNEGFNLDPPRIDQSNGEALSFPNDRGGADARHLNRANVLWVDGHGSAESLMNLGYKLDPDGSYRFDGDNALWSGKGRDIAWTPGYQF